MPLLCAFKARHTDDSEVTLNVCLGRDFKGGLVVFGPLRGAEEEQISASASSSSSSNSSSDNSTTKTSSNTTLNLEAAAVAAVAVVEPRVGRAILHRGRQLHEVVHPFPLLELPDYCTTPPIQPLFILRFGVVVEKIVSLVLLAVSSIPVLFSTVARSNSFVHFEKKKGAPGAGRRAVCACALGSLHGRCARGDVPLLLDEPKGPIGAWCNKQLHLRPSVESRKGLVFVVLSRSSSLKYPLALKSLCLAIAPPIHLFK